MQKNTKRVRVKPPKRKYNTHQQFMDNEITGEAPWIKFDPRKRINVIPGRHLCWPLYVRDEDGDEKDVIAMWFIKDCNQAGTYYRVIRWVDNSPKSYFDVISLDAYPFDMEFKNVNSGNIVVYTKTGQEYIAIDHKSIHPEHCKLFVKK